MTSTIILPKVSFIIVNYNTCQLLDKCIANLLGIYANMEIIVVVNGDSDGSSARVREKYLDKVILLVTENKGLATAHNEGLAKASGDYLIHLGTDAYPTKEAISKIIDFMETHKDVGLATPKLVLRDGSRDIDAHRGFPTPWASLTHFAGLDKIFPRSPVFGKYFLGYKGFDTVHEIEVCISHFMCVRRSVWEKVGPWDQQYFLFGEDVDYCFRVKEAGFKNMYLGNVEVLHYKGATVGRKTASDLKTASATSKDVLKKLPEQSTTAMRIFYTAHYAKKYPKMLTALVLSGIFILLQIRRFSVLVKNL